MRKITRMALTVTAVTTTAAALTTTPAWAVIHGVYLPGVPSPSIQPITGRNSGSVAAAVSSGGFLTCVDVGLSKALTVTGTVKVGTTGLGVIGSLTGLTFSNCTIAGLPATVTPQNLPWSLSASGYTGSGVTPVQLGGVRVMVNIPGIPCTATLQGTTSTNGLINGTHTNPPTPGSPSTLSLPFASANNLKATGVSVTCPPSIVKNGDAAKISSVIELRGVNSTANEGPTVVLP